MTHERCDDTATQQAEHTPTYSPITGALVTNPSPKRKRGVEHRSLALPARKEWCVNAYGRLALNSVSLDLVTYLCQSFEELAVAKDFERLGVTGPVSHRRLLA